MSHFTRSAAFSVALASALAAAGCSSEGTSYYQQYFRLVRSTWSDEGSRVPLSQISANPYASIGMRLGGSPETMLVLGSDNGGTLLWTSASNLVLVTRNGRILKTAGFEFNLAGTQSNGIDIANALRKTFTERYEVDLGTQFSVPINCTVSRRGSEQVTIIGNTMRLARVEQRCRADQSDWDFTNVYWLSLQTGFVWRSVQYVHPKLPAITVETFRPPG